MSPDGALEKRQLSRFGIRFVAGRMWFDELPHTALQGDRGWQVSWLPGRDDLSPEQARDALIVAKLSTSYRMREFARRDWPRIKELALALRVDPRDAVKLVRDAEAHSREQAIPTLAQHVSHLGTARPGEPDRVILVDPPTAPTVRTPGRSPGQWLAAGERVSLDRGELDR
ncbi:hypothetical protein [Nocardia wallacei]|uniref:hypothetical protein n=1 Tax=Nocardia wallacei TaxID=480035 RepID=UPI0024537670|nr:hypothetical protein [Nocardia wallacei]